VFRIAESRERDDAPWDGCLEWGNVKKRECQSADDNHLRFAPRTGSYRTSPMGFTAKMTVFRSCETKEDDREWTGSRTTIHLVSYRQDTPPSSILSGRTLGFF
jgi:hypothetical protein